MSTIQLIPSQLVGSVPNSSNRSTCGLIMPAEGDPNAEPPTSEAGDTEVQPAGSEFSVDIMPLAFRCMYTKRGGFIFFMKLYDLEEDRLSYDIIQNIHDEKGHLVVYKSYKPFIIASLARDLNDNWTIKVVEIESDKVNVNGPLWAKYHQSWRSMDNQGCAAAFERVQSNLYAAKMLRHFQHALKSKWLKPGRALKRKKMVYIRTLHALSKGLQVPAASVMHTIGTLLVEPAWLLFESQVDDENQRYVHPYAFACTQDPDEPWTHLIHAFLHYTHEKSGLQSLIAQLDCDGNGIISNVICYHKRSTYASVELGGVIDRAFSLFQGAHKCNAVCHELDLPPFVIEDTWN